MPPTYLWRCETCEEDIEVFRHLSDYKSPPEHPHPVKRVLTVPYAMPDIAPYRAVAGDMKGKFISGRREHREFLKRNRLVEVGDEPVRPTKEFRKNVYRRGELARDIKEAIAEHCVPDLKRGGLKERHGS